MPALKVCDAGRLVEGRDGRLVEGGVGGMLERGTFEAFVVVDGVVADESHLPRGMRDIALRCGMRINFGVASVLLLPCPYESDGGSNACGMGTSGSAYLTSGTPGPSCDKSVTGCTVPTFVNAYCCSGDRFRFQKRKASYWKRIESENVPELSFATVRHCTL
jgi:hypothetical protein